MNRLVILLGGNIGDKIPNLTKAVFLIESELGKVVLKSSLYESEPWGYDDAYQYLNAVVIVETSYSAKRCLDVLLSIERKLGRTRKQTKTYEARTIDLDVLFYNNDIIEEKDLLVPHPLLHKRNFTLIPLKELIPNFIHPMLKKSIITLYKESNDVSLVNKIGVFK